MRLSIAFLGVLAVATAGSVASFGQTQPPGSLKPVAAFAGIADRKERSVALFVEAGKVLQHARCVNCHPAGDRPLQGNDAHPHQPLVTRGVDGMGAAGMRCPTCHGRANFEPGGVPGNPVWHLAPIEMAWVGKSLAEVCVQIKDRTRNGNKSLADLVHHMGEDPLVAWAWRPGGDRQPVPGTHEEFHALVSAWVETGAACPSP